MAAYFPMVIAQLFLEILLRSIYLCKHGKACQVGGEERQNREIPWLNSWKLPGERQSSFYSPPPPTLPPPLLPPPRSNGWMFQGMDLPRQAIPWPAMVCLHTPQTLGFLKSFFLKLWGHVVNSSGWKSKGKNCQHLSSWRLLLFFFFISFLGDNKSSEHWKGLKEELYQANYSSRKESVDDILESRGQLTLCQVHLPWDASGVRP